ncbi:MAG: DUF4282 domain-containing protein [Kiritimatiellia bacterium]
MSFAKFITPRVIKVLYVIGIVFAALGAIVLVLKGFRLGIWRGILHLVLSPIVFLLYVLFARIWCEMILVVFRIAGNTDKLVEEKKA